MNPLVEATLYRDAGNVTRYHAKRTIRQQSVAEHTFGVLMLVKQVAGTWLLDERLVLVYAAVMHHDLTELITGDLPAPIKRAHPELGPLMERIEQDLQPLYCPVDLTSEEEALIKWADRMELVLWCLEEYRMGNSYMADTVRKGMGWILAAPLPRGTHELTQLVTDECVSLGMYPATGAELEMKR